MDCLFIWTTGYSNYFKLAGSIVRDMTKCIIECQVVCTMGGLILEGPLSNVLGSSCIKATVECTV